MPSYIDIKQATISLLDTYSHNHDILKEYGKPIAAPKFSAATKLATLGINAYVRRAMMKPTNEVMRGKFPDSWKAVGASELKNQETIGDFIKLMCSCNSIAVPFGEPK